MDAAATARSEADEYRQRSDRPLAAPTRHRSRTVRAAGYTLLMVVFAALVGIVGAAAALGSVRLRRISPYDLLLLIAGTHKAARLLSKDAVTSPLRMPFTRFKGSGGPAKVIEEPRRRLPPTPVRPAATGSGELIRRHAVWCGRHRVPGGSCVL